MTEEKNALTIGNGGLSSAKRMRELETLDQIQKKVRSFEKAEARWRAARKGVFIAPFVTAAALFTPTIKREIWPILRIESEAISIVATGAGSLAANARRQKMVAGRMKAGNAAVPIVEQLNMPTPAWLERALAPDVDVDPYIPPDQQEEHSEKF